MRTDMGPRSAIKVLRQFETGGVAYTTYVVNAKAGPPTYVARGFVASGEVCGDLEFYGKGEGITDEEMVKSLFAGYQLNPNYTPEFRDLLFYAQVLFDKQHMAKAAAPLFEKALNLVPHDGAPFPSALIAKRVTRDQAGMAYGISGNLAKARAIFDQGVAEDPNYPLYYYNLACADAGENKLAEARAHLQQAFQHQADVNPGESMPDPTVDDSFTPYRNDKEFWKFVEGLKTSK